MFAKLLRRIRQWRCKHEARLCDLQPRDADGMVTWPCRKCGKVWRGDHGLALPLTWRVVGPAVDPLFDSQEGQLWP